MLSLKPFLNKFVVFTRMINCIKCHCLFAKVISPFVNNALVVQVFLLEDNEVSF